MRLYPILFLLAITFLPNWVTAQTRSVVFNVTVIDDASTYTDANTKIYFHPNARNGWDVYDASKLSPLSSFYVSFGFLGMRGDEIRNKTQESRPLFLAERIEIDTRLLLMQIEGEISIGVSDFINIPENWEFYLIDTETDSTHNLRSDDYYTFNQNLEDSYFYQTDERFKVIVDPNTDYNEPPVISGSGWQMLGWPVTGQTISDLAVFGPVQGISELPDDQASPNLFTHYDGEHWVLPDHDDVLQPGHGLIWYNFSNTNLSPVFEPHVIHYQEINIPLHSIVDGWNLIANPWFYPIDFNDLVISGGVLESDVALWWDNQAGEGLGSYVNSNTTNGIIPPLAGFFIKNSTATDINFPVTAQRDDTSVKLFDFQESDHLQFIITAYRDNEPVHYNQALVIKPEVENTEIPVSLDNSGIESGFRVSRSDHKFVQISNHEFEINSSVLICVEADSQLDYAEISVISSLANMEWKINSNWQSVASGSRIEINGESLCIPLRKSNKVTSVEPNEIPEKIQIISYPNPFNPIATIAFRLPESEHITLEIFDIHGRLLDTLAEGRFSAGHHTFHWNGQDYGSGMYLYRLRLDHYQMTNKMILIK